MREILFRGKRTDNGEWVEGYYLHQRESLTDKNACYIAANNGYGFKYISVDPSTVGQYTGLTDKNGRKIFEGDIVRYGDTIHKVVFEQRNGTAYFGIVISDIETWLFGNECPANLMEVIGNIYDNPELMKGGNENG